MSNPQGDTVEPAFMVRGVLRSAQTFVLANESSHRSMLLPAGTVIMAALTHEGVRAHFNTAGETWTKLLDHSEVDTAV